MNMTRLREMWKWINIYGWKENYVSWLNFHLFRFMSFLQLAVIYLVMKKHWLLVTRENNIPPGFEWIIAATWNSSMQWTPSSLLQPRGRICIYKKRIKYLRNTNFAKFVLWIFVPWIICSRISLSKNVSLKYLKQIYVLKNIYINIYISFKYKRKYIYVRKSRNM